MVLHRICISLVRVMTVYRIWVYSVIVWTRILQPWQMPPIQIMQYWYTGLTSALCPANERRLYLVTKSSLMNIRVGTQIWYKGGPWQKVQYITLNNNPRTSLVTVAGKITQLNLNLYLMERCEHHDSSKYKYSFFLSYDTFRQTK